MRTMTVSATHIILLKTNALLSNDSSALLKYCKFLKLSRLNILIGIMRMAHWYIKRIWPERIPRITHWLPNFTNDLQIKTHRWIEWVYPFIPLFHHFHRKTSYRSNESKCPNSTYNICQQPSGAGVVNGESGVSLGFLFLNKLPLKLTWSK